MDATMLHADRRRPALVHGAAAPWVASPQPGVERRLLERAGGEVAVATSIVRYAPGTSFPAHNHDRGEEFLVLEGVFSDEHGHYPAGTYVRNPPGSRHAPFSTAGCVIFVKLRQMAPDPAPPLRLHPEGRVWAAAAGAGHEQARLFAGGGVTVGLERLAPGVERRAQPSPHGEELFVVQGSLYLLEPEHAELQAWSWSRRPTRCHAGRAGPHGALVWVQRGHL